MHTAQESLLTLTARDLMSPDLVRIPQDMSLQTAAERLAEADLHGAPVVDANGRCVGVLSTTDFLYLAMKGKTHATEPAHEGFFSPWHIIEPSKLPVDSVADHMSRLLLAVTPDAPIGKLARLMVDKHVHRLIVEEGGDLVGIVSAIDLLEAFAKCAEAEMPVAV